MKASIQNTHTPAFSRHERQVEALMYLIADVFMEEMGAAFDRMLAEEEEAGLKVMAAGR